MAADLPPPQVPARRAELSEIPKTALKLAAAAEKHGWAVRVMYARGPVRSTNEDGHRMVDLIAVQMAKPGRRLAGCWHDGSFECGLGAHLRKYKSKELMEEVVSYGSEQARAA